MSSSAPMTARMLPRRRRGWPEDIWMDDDKVSAGSASCVISGTTERYDVSPKATPTGMPARWLPTFTLGRKSNPTKAPAAALGAYRREDAGEFIVPEVAPNTTGGNPG